MPGKVFGFLLLAMSLAGCVDAKLDVALTGANTAKASLLQEMRPDSFTAVSLADTLGETEWRAAVKAVGDATLAKKEAEEAGKDASDIVIPPLPPFYQPLAAKFCTSGGLLKRVDGGASCIETGEGAFGDIALGPLQQPLTFTPEGDGLIRIALPTQQLLDAVRPDMVLTPDIEAIIPALFANRRISIRFSGAEVTETNMTLAKDGLSASQDIAILDLISGKSELPDEFYAVVRAP
ncbi:hypothetical protein [Devosia sp. YR412]|uniref:hypothetical protein n=1 Tax=Devosia sp. YR412 TaxID=1881030 RepID=UPI000B889346|nr:hypothetical protein [Devosia sp. YR412]